MKSESRKTARLGIAAILAVGFSIVLLSLSNGESAKFATGGTGDYCSLPAGYSTIQEIVTDGRAASKTTSSTGYPTSTLTDSKFSFRATLTKVFDYQFGYMQSKNYGILVYSASGLLSSYHVGEFLDVAGATYSLYLGRHEMKLDDATITILADQNPSPVTVWSNPTESAVSSDDYSGRLASISSLSVSSSQAVVGSSSYVFGAPAIGTMQSVLSTNLTYLSATSIPVDFSGVISERYSTGDTLSLTKEFVVGENDDLVLSHSGTLINAVSMNDLHGAIEKNASSYEPGLSRIGSFLKSNFSSNDLLLANGDMWQGNGESNMNRGALITKWMNANNFDAMSIGNHDFDWGQSVLTTNKGLADYAILGGNIYHYVSGAATTLDTDISDGATAIFTVNGIKIGLIGMIGSSQYTSITNSNVSDLAFQSPIPLAETLATSLRNDSGCDLVLMEIHDGVATSTYADLCGKADGSGTKYVDAIFGGHTHSIGLQSINGVPLLMTTGKDQLSHLSINVSGGVASVIGGLIDLVPVNGPSDAASQSVIDQYSSQNATLDEVCGSVSANFATANLANLYCQASYSYISSQFSGVQLVISNSARNYMPAGTVTFRDIYRSLPFDNHFVIGTVTGQDLYKETVSYINPIYHPDASFAKPTSGSATTYKVAIIDYLADHVNASHVADYFPSLVKEGTLSTGVCLPRDIVRAYFLAQPSPVAPSSFASTLSSFSYQ
jgi:2',3'-cyclic-nucleotide 2'-phosphodiesterase (5'-nucleotidase family)